MRATASLTVLLGAVVLTSVSACGENRPVTSRPTARVIVAVAGVGVTWLPTGYATDGSSVSSVVDGGAATVLDFAGVPADSNKPQPRLVLNVSREHAVDVSKDGEGAVTTHVKVHGIAAQLTRAEHFRGTEGHSDSDLYLLDWAESGAYLSVMGVYGATRNDVEGFAAGLVVDGSGKAFASPDAERQIRSAFADAFTGRPTPDQARALGAIEHGEQLRVAYDQLVAKLPETARSARVTVQQVSFTAADRAQVQFAVTAQFQGRETSLTVGGQEVSLVNGAWKVSQIAYCKVMQQVGIACP
jgi:hypothetical protein